MDPMYDYAQPVEESFNFLMIFRILGLLPFPISRLICFIILRVKVKNQNKFVITRIKDRILMVIRISFMLGAITVAILSFIIPAQMVWTQIVVDQTSAIIMACFGIAIVACSCILLYMSTYTLVKSALNKDLPNIVTKGPFRIMRHPMHGAFLVFIMGAFIIRLNWFFDVLMFCSWIVGVFELASEEASLVAKYGNDYINYKERVGVFWPWPVLDCGVSKKKAKSIVASSGSNRATLLPKEDSSELQ